MTNTRHALSAEFNMDSAIRMKIDKEQLGRFRQLTDNPKKLTHQMGFIDADDMIKYLSLLCDHGYQKDAVKFLLNVEALRKLLSKDKSFEIWEMIVKLKSTKDQVAILSLPGVASHIKVNSQIIDIWGFVKDLKRTRDQVTILSAQDAVSTLARHGHAHEIWEFVKNLKNTEDQVAILSAPNAVRGLANADLYYGLWRFITSLPPKDQLAIWRAEGAKIGLEIGARERCGWNSAGHQINTMQDHFANLSKRNTRGAPVLQTA